MPPNIELYSVRSHCNKYLLLFMTKLPPVSLPLPLVALFVPILLGIVPPKVLVESQGVISYFSTESVGFLLEKK